jgi:hypothetical protein
MRTRLIILLTLGLGLTRSDESHALTYSDTAAAMGGELMAPIGVSQASDEDPEVQTKGRGMIKTGLIISGACSALGNLVFVAAVAALASLDQVETLEAELANGGGPTIDALASGFGLPKSEVMRSIQLNLQTHVNVEQVDLKSFQHGVPSDLSSQLKFTTFTAADTLIALQAETESGVIGEGSKHHLIAELAGVPVTVVRGVVGRSISQHLSSHAQDGKVISARALLHVGSIGLIESIISDVESSRPQLAISG